MHPDHVLDSDGVAQAQDGDSLSQHQLGNAYRTSVGKAFIFACKASIVELQGTSFQALVKSLTRRALLE